MLVEDAILAIVLAVALVGIFFRYDIKVRRGEARWEDLEKDVLLSRKGRR